MNFLLILSLAVLLAACGDGSSNRGPDTPTQQDKFQGYWKRLGYGQLLQIEGATLSRYDFTTQTCVLTEVESVDDFDDVQLSDHGTEIVLGLGPLVFEERYTKVNRLPDACATHQDDSPSQIYSHVWHTFNEYYAFFSERQVDWLAQFDATRDAVRSGMSNDDLFAVSAVTGEGLADLLAALPSKLKDPRAEALTK